MKNIEIDLEQLRHTIITQDMSKEDRERIKKMTAQELQKRLQDMQQKNPTDLQNAEIKNELRLNK
ncbi:MAG: hypothetical protein KDD55_13565 [Bdellovibrionales bacterium]|nr:hypothetical protein [Bdellovibrionales bacterium]